MGDNVGVVLLGEGLAIQEGSSVTATGKIAQVPVGEAFLGRVVDSLAQPIDGKGDIPSSETRLIESNAPGIISRRSVYEPLQTGLVSVAIGQKASTVAQIIDTLESNGAMEYTTIVAA